MSVDDRAPVDGPQHAPEILAQYEANYGLFNDFSRYCENLIRELVSGAGHRVHSVNARVKKREQLEEKLRRAGKEYEELSAVTDVVGIRIITYFEDEVDRIGSLIEREFSVDAQQSIDKRKVLDPDRFGYLSLHYICSLSEPRVGLAENRRYKDLVCEIQIRSVLQHAWAEIEHDLGYKAGSTVPAPIRRRFSRLAGLLELADQEFKSIREELAQYSQKVEEEIEVTDFEIDDLSLAAFIEADEATRHLENTMAQSLGRSIGGTRDTTKLATELRYAGITTINQLREALTSYKEIIIDQYKARFSHAVGSKTDIQKGASLFQLFQMLIAAKGEDALVAAFKQFNIHSLGGTPEISAKEAYSIIRNFLP